MHSMMTQEAEIPDLGIRYYEFFCVEKGRKEVDVHEGTEAVAMTSQRLSFFVFLFPESLRPKGSSTWGSLQRDGTNRCGYRADICCKAIDTTVSCALEWRSAVSQQCGVQ